MLRSGCLLVSLALVFGLPGSAQSQEGRARYSEGSGQAMGLSLADAIAMSIENNLDVEIARHDPLIAWERNREAWGAYDPEAFAEIQFESRETPTASVLVPSGAISDEEWTNSNGLRGLVPVLSTEYQLDFGGRRLKTDSTANSLAEEKRSSLNLTITQPLLRNLYWNQPWTEVKVSKQFYRQSLDDFRRALMDTVRTVEEGYWELVATDEQQRVAEKSLEAAKELLEQTNVQFEVGVVSKVEVFEAEAGVAERDVELIRARNDRDGAEDRLIDEVLGRQLTAGSTLRLDPTDRPDEYTDLDVDLEEANAKALERRPELASIDRQIRQREIELASARNQLAPQIDLQAGVGYQGLAGKQCSPPTGPTGAFSLCSPETQFLTGERFANSFRDSYEDFFDHDGDLTWRVGANFSVPIGNNARRARRRSAEIELRKSRTQRSRQIQDIALEVRDAARNLNSAREGIEAAERRRLAAEEQFRAEGIRLEQGESTPFDVLERERDLVEAESQKINAFRTYRDSVVELERAQGTILERHNIVVDDARRLR